MGNRLNKIYERAMDNYQRGYIDKGIIINNTVLM